MNKKPDEIAWLWNVLTGKKTIIGIIVCAILAFLVTRPVFMRPLYESETLVYVPLTILNQQLNQQGIGFANDHEVDQYIQILKSASIADSLINRFEVKGNLKKNELHNQLKSRIKIEKTRYHSVSIKVRDHNPKKAADMANQMIYLVDTIKHQLFYPNRLEAMKYSKSLFEQKLPEVTALEKKMDSIEKNQTALSLKNNWLYIKLKNSYDQELQELISRKNQYQRALKDFETPLPKTYVIASAVTTDKPVWPKPLLICLLAAGGYLIVIFFIEIIKRDFSKETP